LSGYIFATKPYIDNQKNLLNSNIVSACPHNTVNFGPLAAEIGWRVWGHPCKFQRVSRLGFVTAPMSLNRGQPNFARCLAVSWAATVCIHFGGLLTPDGNFSCAKFTLSLSLAFSYIGSVTARHSNTGRQPNFAAWYKEWNYGTFAPRHFQQRAPPIFRGRPSRWA